MPFFIFGQDTPYAEYPIHVANTREELAHVRPLQVGGQIHPADTAQQIIDAQVKVGGGMPFTIVWNIGNR